eukprot:NODE_33_length_32023_cov_0.217579.p16 type:complete len:204 gc:universal NODE_33_length_32023_cov_0.217579:28272-28883(+)
MLSILPIIYCSIQQDHWAEDYQYTVRTEENSQKISYVMLADELYQVPCGRKTAGWVRTMWHDFGTYSRVDNTGGLDGSIIYELGRLENTRLDTPTYNLANKANTYGVSLSDTIALAAIIAIRKCGGPKIPFFYGREDAASANPGGRMLFTNATFDMMTSAMIDVNGMSFPQFVASIGVGHTIGKLNAVHITNAGLWTNEGGPS